MIDRCLNKLCFWVITKSLVMIKVLSQWQWYLFSGFESCVPWVLPTQPRFAGSSTCTRHIRCAQCRLRVRAAVYNQIYTPEHFSALRQDSSPTRCGYPAPLRSPAPPPALHRAQRGASVAPPARAGVRPRSAAHVSGTMSHSATLYPVGTSRG